MARYLVPDGINHSLYTEDVARSASEETRRLLLRIPARELYKARHFNVILHCLIQIISYM